MASIFAVIKRWLGGSHQIPLKGLTDKEIHLEPKYWAEVKHFMDSITEIVHTHTIEDNNVQILNQRIIDYVEQQINTKGSLADIEQRYTALNTLADRILINNLSKIVGLKHSPNTSADFTQAVEQFKRELNQRHKEELTHHKHQKH